MTLLFRACFGFLIAFAAVQPQPLTSAFGTKAIASLKADLADAERQEATRAQSPLDTAIVRAANVLREAARVHQPRS
jgi:hypothetical protein